MIFVTVGTELPFDRLIRVVDEWASASSRDDVFAQIGDSDLAPLHVRHCRFLTPIDFTRHFAAATAVVGHAGMGTILSALRYGKPLVVMPRRASLGEQRNDHQLATARRLDELGRVSVAFDESSLRARLDELDQLRPRDRIGPFASPELIAAVRQFILAPGRVLGR